MYVEKLTIKNYRCFSDAEVVLNYPGRIPQRRERLPERFKNVTLLVGGNGAGKTAVCSALCLAVLAPIIRNSGLRVDYFVHRSLGYDGDRAERTKSLPLDNADIRAFLKLDKTDTEKPPTTTLIGQAVIRRQSDFEEITTAINNPSAWERIYENDSPAFFTVAYGSNRRSALPEGYSERSRSPRYQRVASIFEEYFGLVPFTLGYLELQRYERLDEAKTILNDLLPDGVSLTESNDNENRPLFDVFGVLQPFTALSDGYRGFIAWVWDLLVQITRVLTRDSNRNALREMAGVVIVDEVDLFLHPVWQRFLIEEFADRFSNLQFIFSTHSPLVVGMLQNENLRVINRDRDGTRTIEQYEEKVEGKTPNEILTSSYFGLSSTRSPRSGSLSEQMVRERIVSATVGETLPEISELQRKKLSRLMAQSGQYDRALREAENEVER